MDQTQKRIARMSVPEFGGWDNFEAGVTDYSLVFTQARENKKLQKTDLTELRRKNIEKEPNLKNVTYQKNHHSHHRQHPRHHAIVRPQPRKDPVVKKTVLTYINCCIKP